MADPGSNAFAGWVSDRLQDFVTKCGEQSRHFIYFLVLDLDLQVRHAKIEELFFAANDGQSLHLALEIVPMPLTLEV